MKTQTAAAPLPADARLNIAEYTLGTLYGHEESQVRELINSNDEAVHLALHWETVLLAMADRLPPANPDPLMLARIQRTLGLPRLDPEVQPLWRPEAPSHQGAPAPEPALAAWGASPPDSTPAPRTEPVISEPGSLPNISPHPAENGRDVRTLSPDPELLSPAFPADEAHHRHARQPAWYTRPLGMLALAALAGISVLAYTALRPGTGSNQASTDSVQNAASKPAETISIAILQPPNSSSTPGWVVIQTGQGQLQADPRLQSEKNADQGLALWTRSPDSPNTRFLGWLDDTTVNTLVLPDGVIMGDNALYEITLEKQGIDTGRAPEGVVLFIGQAVKTAVPDPKAQKVKPGP